VRRLAALDVTVNTRDHCTRRRGPAEVRIGAVESGMSRLDEAMAAVLGGEATELETFGELCCALLAACASGIGCSTRRRTSVASCR
jgi:hypothetical protein